VGLRSVEEYPTSSVGLLSHLVIRNQDEIRTVDAGHIALHDPARALRAVEVKRRILSELFDNYPEPRADGDEALWHKVGHDYARFKVIRLLVSEFSEHPDYREEWRPSPAAS